VLNDLGVNFSDFDQLQAKLTEAEEGEQIAESELENNLEDMNVTRD
jgi:hypothetical protein